MDLGNYVTESFYLAEELKQLPTPRELEALHKALMGKSVHAWLDWRSDNAELVSEFVAATPSERAKRKKFQEARLFLIMAGVQHCLEGHALLKTVSNAYLVPGGSYRGMTATAGDAYDRLLAVDIPYWPFDDMETPFKDDLVRRQPTGE